MTTLGRGGSDTSAVAIGLALKAEKVEFYKDVGGVFDFDPKENTGARKYGCMTYDEVLEIVNSGAKILHPRAIRLAAKNGLHLHVRSFIASNQEIDGTVIFDAGKVREEHPEL